MRRAASCARRNHRPAGNSGHPGPPRVVRGTRPTADAALTVSGAHPHGRCACQAHHGPPGRARGPSAAGPRGCQATLLTRVSLRRCSARPGVPRAARDDFAVPRYRPDLAKWAFLLTIRLTPAAVLEKFAAMQMVDVHVPCVDGRQLVLSRYTQPDKDQRLVLQALKLTLPEQPPPRIYAHHAARRSLDAPRRRPRRMGTVVPTFATVDQ